MLFGIPIRSFATAKTRLSALLTPGQRREMAVEMSSHTLNMASSVGEAVIVTGDAEVADWGKAQSFRTLDDSGSLNGAGLALVRLAGSQPWGLLHADLPALASIDLQVAIERYHDRGCAMAPSWDGGTSLIMTSGPFAFSYGPGSFRRHLRLRPEAAVVVRAGLALDVDEPDHVDWMQTVRLSG